VALLTGAGAGIDPAWLLGAYSLADAIEEALTGAHDGPIELHPRSLAARAIENALRLTGRASFDATSEHAVLLRTIREAQTPPALV
jgi:hypothetical protein